MSSESVSNQSLPGPGSFRIKRPSSALTVIALVIGVIAIAMSAYTLVGLTNRTLPAKAPAQTLFAGTIYSAPVSFSSETVQQAIQSVTVGGTQETNGLDSHLLALSVTLSYPCPYYNGQPTGIIAQSNCFVTLVQGKTFLDATTAFIPFNETIIDYNIVVPSGPFNLVVGVFPNVYTSPSGAAPPAFSAVIVLDDLGQAATS